MRRPITDKPVNRLVLLPGSLFWVFLVIALITQNPVVITLTAVLAVGTALAFGGYAFRTWRSSKTLRRRVWADGTPATATVLRAQTSGSLNNHPYVDLELEVTAPGAAPRVVLARQLISQLMLSKVQPGASIAVKVDPTDPGVVVLDEELTPYGY
ncbi:hypothetical protein [Marmoricola sp. RAF53]|uniref:hypothetical protein n=1 Tax=Marmoricola sp. RAF53 TaxID=3233059 RepID=UPI003F9C469E